METPYFRPTDRRMINRCRTLLSIERTLNDRLKALDWFAHKHPTYAYKAVKATLPCLINEYKSHKSTLMCTDLCLNKIRQRVSH